MSQHQASIFVKKATIDLTVRCAVIEAILSSYCHIKESISLPTEQGMLRGKEWQWFTLMAPTSHKNTAGENWSECASAGTSYSPGKL